MPLNFFVDKSKQAPETDLEVNLSTTIGIRKYEKIQFQQKLEKKSNTTFQMLLITPYQNEGRKANITRIQEKSRYLCDNEFKPFDNTPYS